VSRKKSKIQPILEKARILASKSKVIKNSKSSSTAKSYFVFAGFVVLVSVAVSFASSFGG
jgi:hypothetical protein